MAAKRQKVAVIGGSGYTGGELVRLLLRHPGVSLTAVASRRLEGRPLADSFPWLGGLTALTFTSPEKVIRDKSVVLVFTALGHMESVEVVPDLLSAGKKVVDLSADFRFRDPAAYDVWYGQKHPRPDLLKGAVYGLPELNRKAIAGTALCANPGCYATTVILGLLPLAARGVLPESGVVVDAKSGVSGAGRAPKDNTVFPECHEGLRPYSPGRHRHLPEIEAALAKGKKRPTILFVPHLLPANRGIMASAYVPAPFSLGKARALYGEFYREEPFVKVNQPGQIPGIQDVRGSNWCRIGLDADPAGKYLMVFAAIDNLVKGASGQAIQNMNLMLGLPETAGLDQLALAP